MHVQELTKVYDKELCPEGIYLLFGFSSVIHNKINDRNRINGCTKLRGNTEIFLSPNFASLLIAVDADQCSSFTRFHHNSAFTMVRFHHDITSCIIYRKNDLRFHTAVKVHARVCSSRALNFPESRRKEPVRTSLCFWPKRRSDPGISHYFLATTGINHLILYPFALCNFSFVRLVGSCFLPYCTHREKRRTVTKVDF